jgi:predicted patatin/cPLA2 family phospholipase
MSSAVSSSISPVISAILKRRDDGSLPGERSDGRKIALAIEGGAMRGVVSAAMVCALDQLNLVNCFDAVYGSSAGAINGAFLLSRQTRLGIRVYYQDINNARFINPPALAIAKVLRGESFVDVDFPVYEVLLRRKRLDFARVLASPVPLNVLTASLDTLSTKVWSHCRSIDELAAALRASSTMPGIAGGPVIIDGHRLVDALLYERVPLASLRNQGFTDVLFLRTRAQGQKPPAPWLETRVMRRLIRLQCPEAVTPFKASAAIYEESLSQIERSEGGTLHGFCVAALYPPRGLAAVGRLETNRERLLDAARQCYCQALRDLGVADPQVVEVLSGFDPDAHSLDVTS